MVSLDAVTGSKSLRRAPQLVTILPQALYPSHRLTRLTYCGIAAGTNLNPSYSTRDGAVGQICRYLDCRVCRAWSRQSLSVPETHDSSFPPFTNPPFSSPRAPCPPFKFLCLSAWTSCGLFWRIKCPLLASMHQLRSIINFAPADVTPFGDLLEFLNDSPPIKCSFPFIWEMPCSGMRVSSPAVLYFKACERTSANKNSEVYGGTNTRRTNKIFHRNSSIPSRSMISSRIGICRTSSPLRSPKCPNHGFQQKT